MEHTIRYTEDADALFLEKELIKESIKPHFPFGSEEEVKDAVRIWINFPKYTRRMCSLTLLVEGLPAGMGIIYLMPYRKLCHHAQFQFLIAEDLRGQGLGTSLLKNLKHLAKNHLSLEILTAEVFGLSQAAHGLLLKDGFKSYARQEGYIEYKGEFLSRDLYEYTL